MEFPPWFNECEDDGENIDETMTSSIICMMHELEEYGRSFVEVGLSMEDADRFGLTGEDYDDDDT